MEDVDAVAGTNDEDRQNDSSASHAEHMEQTDAPGDEN